MTDNRWRVNSMVRAYGKFYCADHATGAIGILDAETYDEFGSTMRSYVRAAPIKWPNNYRLFLGKIELLMEAGVGLTSGQGSDPQIMMRFSDDGARIFSSVYSRSFGKIGEYTRRVVWRRQGRSPFNRVYEFSITDPVKRVIYEMTAHANEGTGT